MYEIASRQISGVIENLTFQSSLTINRECSAIEAGVILSALSSRRPASLSAYLAISNGVLKWHKS